MTQHFAWPALALVLASSRDAEASDGGVLVPSAASPLPPAAPGEAIGERVRAVPKGRDPRASMFLVALGVVVAGIALAVLVRRWRRTPVDAASVAVAERRDALDELIDAELSDLDG